MADETPNKEILIERLLRVANYHANMAFTLKRVAENDNIHKFRRKPAKRNYRRHEQWAATLRALVDTYR